MGRENWVVIRAYLPAALWIAMALLAIGVLSGMRDIPYASTLITTLRWVPAGMLAWAVILAGGATYRLWQWERGIGPSCNHCASPLGHERPGVRGRGVYRRCLGCGINVNHKHYVR